MVTETGLPIIFFQLNDDEVERMTKAAVHIDTLQYVMCPNKEIKNYDQLDPVKNQFFKYEYKLMGDDLDNKIKYCIKYTNENLMKQTLGVTIPRPPTSRCF